MKREETIEDISHFRENENYIEWMMEINRISREQVLSLTTEEYLGGWCEDFALYFAISHGVPMLFLNHEHNIVKIDCLYFDAADSNGAEKLSDLQYVKESPELSKLTEEELQKLVIVDEDWKGYSPLANHVGMIEKLPA